MKKERILIAQNDSLFNEICSDLTHFKPLLENLKTIYQSLEIGPFTSEIYKEIIHSGTAEISERFRSSIESDIEKMGISKSFIKDNITEKAETLWNTFSGYVSELKKFKPETFGRQKKLNLKQISFNDNGFFISLEDGENILENECRIYLENEKEMELFDNLEHFIEAYDKVSKNLNNLQFRFSYEKGSGVTAIANTFLTLNENKEYSIAPSSIRFAANYKENNLRFNQ